MKLLDDSIAKAGSGALHLYLAKGELLAAAKEFKPAIAAFDVALKSARNNPDTMIDLVAAKSDAIVFARRCGGSPDGAGQFFPRTRRCPRIFAPRRCCKNP